MKAFERICLRHFRNLPAANEIGSSRGPFGLGFEPSSVSREGGSELAGEISIIQSGSVRQRTGEMESEMRRPAAAVLLLLSLWFGKASVPENSAAALFLISKRATTA
ncbi:hypothetical protein [Brucella pseudintermedia]|uniref:hypothetical protein n=1 Tax=Brucella pseudintermedia TaxID=370111 RepID=UPI00124C606F|nr:hypothetical protein [Brucella pseudintermedia]KAB2680909.1 hypothetical protein F9K78_14955 [Brucella pseudintermedia]